jgi:hypothetical protein
VALAADGLTHVRKGWGALLLLAAACTPACITSTVQCGFLAPTEVRLRLQDEAPEAVTVQVLAGRHTKGEAARAFGADGTLAFDIAHPGMHCTRTGGWLSFEDDDFDDVPLLEIRRGERVLLELTPRELDALPQAADGYACLRLAR